MFRSTTIIRELVLNLAKVILMLKHSVKLRRYMLFGDVAACHRAACVLCAVHTTHQLSGSANVLYCWQNRRGLLVNADLLILKYTYFQS